MSEAYRLYIEAMEKMEKVMKFKASEWREWLDPRVESLVNDFYEVGSERGLRYSRDLPGVTEDFEWDLREWLMEMFSWALVTWPLHNGAFIDREDPDDVLVLRDDIEPGTGEKIAPVGWSVEATAWIGRTAVARHVGALDFERDVPGTLREMVGDVRLGRYAPDGYDQGSDRVLFVASGFCEEEDILNGWWWWWRYEAKRSG